MSRIFEFSSVARRQPLMKIAGVAENSGHCTYSIGLKCFGNCLSLLHLVFYLLQSNTRYFVNHLERFTYHYEFRTYLHIYIYLVFDKQIRNYFIIFLLISLRQYNILLISGQSYQFLYIYVNKNLLYTRLLATNLLKLSSNAVQMLQNVKIKLLNIAIFVSLLQFRHMSSCACSVYFIVGKFARLYGFRLTILGSLFDYTELCIFCYECIAYDIPYIIERK